MKLKNIHSLEMAGMKTGIDAKTARKYIKGGKLPSECKQGREWRTKPNAFEAVWPQLEAMLKAAPGLEAKTLLTWLIGQNKEPPFEMAQLRTLQRKVREWRALYGNDKEVMFSQTIYPGRQSQSDYTCMNSVGVTIAGISFPHLLFHFMLPYSRWEAVMICYSESFDSLTAGYTAAVWDLGAVAPEHRTDNLSAATHQIGAGRDFNDRWSDFLGYHRVKPSRNNPGEGHENGSVEKSHDLFKKNVVQELLLRGSKNFVSLEEYQAFIQRIGEGRNQSRKKRLAEELDLLLALPERPWQSVRTICVTVNPMSMIAVLGCVYSVPARLIGFGVFVDIYPDRLEVRYGKRIVETITRLQEAKGASVNYRHVIGYLLRKPGAFAHYQYREHLFPRVVFRKAYDALVEHSPARGHKDYLKILHLSAITSESEVSAALEILLETGQVPLLDALKLLLDLPLSTIPSVRIDAPRLSAYDKLLSGFVGQQEIAHVIH
jgi:hypothetical protein